MAKSMTNYYGLILSPNMEMTVEGYLICKNVPICRSGTQDYLGSELEGFPGYDPNWHLDSSTRYSVLRPKDEVLHPDTISSFEGKTVTDTHPEAEGNVVTVDNDNEVNCGHLQNVRKGPDFGGLVTLQGDMIIKNPQLIEKIRPTGSPGSGLRDVSCGYTLKLKRLASGQLVMTNIRGNHVAVVEKGRAGSRIAIRDSAPPDKPKEGAKMNIMDRIFGRGLKEYVAEASPEDLNELTTKVLLVDKAPPKNGTQPAVDSSPRVVTTPADPFRSAAHAALDRFMDASENDQGVGLDAAGNPTDVRSLRKDVKRFLGDKGKAATDKEGKEEKEEAEEAPAAADAGLVKLKAVGKDDDDAKAADDDAILKPAAQDAGKGHIGEDDDDDTVAADDDDDDDKKGAADDDDDAADDAADGEHAKKEIDDPGKSVLKQAKMANDSIRFFIKSVKPIIASYLTIPKSKRTVSQQTMIDSYNSAVRSINSLGGRAYVTFTKVKIPENIPSLALDSKPQPSSCTCFDGVPFRVGQKRHEEHLARMSKGE